MMSIFILEPRTGPVYHPLYDQSPPSHWRSHKWRRRKKGPSKLGLVREAIGTLGKDAMPKAIQAEVKTKHNRNLDLNLISNYKSIVLKEGGATGPKATPKKKMGRPKKAAVTAVNSKGGITLDEIKAVKALAERLGAEKLKQLAEVLS